MKLVVVNNIPVLLLFFHVSCLWLAFVTTENLLATKGRLKILVFSPGLSFSHVQFLGKIADTLAGAGHEVHFLKLVTDPSFAAKNETKLVAKIHVATPRASTIAKLDGLKARWVKEAISGSWPTFNFLKHPLEDFVPYAITVCQDMIERRELLDQMAAEHFDVGIAEMYDLCPMAILHRIGVRTKLVVSAVPLQPGQMGRRFGIPTFASFMPNLATNVTPLLSSFFARFVNFYNEMYDWYWMDNAHARIQEPLIQKEFGPNFPSLRQIARNVSLVFVNSNPFFEMPRPMSNKIVHIGGIVDKNGHEEEELDEKSRLILDAADSAVLLSFGSITDTNIIAPQMRRAILRAMARFPSVQFLWKLDNQSRQADAALFDAAPNVHTFEWIRQSAVLAHPNLRAFISHCGQNSLGEAARAGIPVVGIPLFADQLYNLVVAINAGLALYVDVRQLNGPNAEDVLAEALEKILHDSQYRQRAQLIRRKVLGTPFAPAERLIRWVEFAAQFPDGGLDELNLPGDEEIGWFVYYSLDAIALTLCILLALLWVIWKLVVVPLMTMAMGGRRMRRRLDAGKIKGQ